MLGDGGGIHLGEINNFMAKNWFRLDWARLQGVDTVFCLLAPFSGWALSTGI